MPPRRTLEVASSSSDSENEVLVVKRRRNSDRLTPSKRSKVNGHSREHSRTSLDVPTRTNPRRYTVSPDAPGGPSTPQPRQMAIRSGGRPVPTSLPGRLQVEVEIPVRRPSSAARQRKGSSEQGVAGPGPETLRNHEQRGLAPVPQPSPSIFRPYLRGEDDGVIDTTSQMESIRDFSSPARGDDAKPNVGTRYTLVDGEEALVASDSDDDIEVLDVMPALSSEGSATGIPPVIEKGVNESVEGSPRESRSGSPREINRGGLMEIFGRSPEGSSRASPRRSPSRSPRQSPSGSPRQSPSGSPSRDECQCRWADCDTTFSSAADLARHIRDHADLSDLFDEASDFTPIPSQFLEDPAVPQLKAEVEELHAEVVACCAALTAAETEVHKLSAQILVLQRRLKSTSEGRPKDISSETLAQLEDKIFLLEQELKVQKSDGEQKEQQLSEAVVQRQEVDQVAKEATQRQSEAEGQLSALQSQRQRVEQQLKQVQQQRAEVEEQLKEEQQKRQQREETIAGLLRENKEGAPAPAPAAAEEAAISQPLASAQQADIVQPAESEQQADSAQPPAPEQAEGAAAQQPADPPVDPEQITDLKKQLKRANKKLALTRDDYNYIKAMYDNASGQATTATRRVEELEQQVEKLQEQLTFGLKQRDMFNTAVVQQFKAEAKLARQQLELVQEQNRRTDDKVRNKASLYKPVQREKEALEIQLHKARDEATTYRERNDELVEQVALLRGRLMGAFDDPEPEEAYLEVEAEPEGEPEAETEATPSPTSVPLRIPIFAPDDAPPPALIRDACLTDGGIEAFRCKWAVGGSFCPEIFQTREELEVHGLEHLSNLQEGSQ